MTSIDAALCLLALAVHPIALLCYYRAHGGPVLDQALRRWGQRVNAEPQTIVLNLGDLIETPRDAEDRQRIEWLREQGYDVRFPEDAGTMDVIGTHERTRR